MFSFAGQRVSVTSTQPSHCIAKSALGTILNRSVWLEAIENLFTKAAVNQIWFLGCSLSTPAVDEIPTDLLLILGYRLPQVTTSAKSYQCLNMLNSRIWAETNFMLALTAFQSALQTVFFSHPWMKFQTDSIAFSVSLIFSHSLNPLR